MNLAEVIQDGEISLFVDILEGYRLSKMVTFALLTLTGKILSYRLSAFADLLPW